MKAVFFSLMILGCLKARADIINCIFTEPFFNIVIDTDARVMTRIAPDWDNPDGEIKSTVVSSEVEVFEISSIEISHVVKVPRYQVVADGKNKMILELSYQGSDGMSDFVYPYSTNYDSIYGGCESDKVKRHIFDYEDEEK